MNKIHIIAIFLFSLFLMPSKTFACGSISENHSCKKEVSSKNDIENCCKGNDIPANKNENGCGGKCGHSKCGCTSSSNGFTSICEINFKNNIFDFPSKNQKYFHSETFLSSGFFSLWLIPKIS